MITHLNIIRLVLFVLLLTLIKCAVKKTVPTADGKPAKYRMYFDTNSSYTINRLFLTKDSNYVLSNSPEYKSTGIINKVNDKITFIPKQIYEYENQFKIVLDSNKYDYTVLLSNSKILPYHILSGGNIYKISKVRESITFDLSDTIIILKEQFKPQKVILDKSKWTINIDNTHSLGWRSSLINNITQGIIDENRIIIPIKGQYIIFERINNYLYESK